MADRSQQVGRTRTTLLRRFGLLPDLGGHGDRDLHQARDYEGIKALLAEPYPDEKPKTRINWTSQVAPFVFYMPLGDWVVMPHKRKPAIAFGEVSKGYEAFTPATPRRATAPQPRRMSGSGCGRDARRAP